MGGFQKGWEKKEKQIYIINGFIYGEVFLILNNYRNIIVL